MGYLLRVALLCCVLGVAGAVAQTGVSGHWEGSVQLPNRELQITVDLAKNEKGEWIGTFSQTSQNVRNVPLADVKVDEKSVKFRIGLSGPNAPDFDCALDSPGAMRCTLTTPGGGITVPLKRTGEAKVELAKLSPAVSTELEGNWEGSIETPNGSLRVVLHLKNQPDRTVKGTIDSLDQNSMDLPLTDIVQQGSAVEFQLRIVNGGYKGTLNKEATQIVGQWTQSGSTLPLTFRKAAAK